MTIKKKSLYLTATLLACSFANPIFANEKTYSETKLETVRSDKARVEASLKEAKDDLKIASLKAEIINLSSKEADLALTVQKEAESLAAVNEAEKEAEVEEAKKAEADKKAFVEKFALETLGEAIDLDGSYGAQCWDYANLYLQELGSKGIAGKSGRAGWVGHEFKEQLADEGFTVIEDPALSDLKVGDVICIRPGYSSDPTYGHIGMVEEVNPDGSFTTLEQNAEKGQIAARYTRTYDASDITSIIRK